MKTLVLALFAAGALSGCVAYPYDPYYQEGYPATGYYYPYAYGGYYHPHYYYSPRYYGYRRHADPRDRDRDRVPNWQDRRPYDPRQR